MNVWPSFPGASQVALPACQCRRCKRSGLTPGPGRSPGGGHANPLQYSCLGNPMDTEARGATVQRAARSQTRMRRLNTRAHTLSCWRILICMCFSSPLYSASTPIIFDILVLNKQVISQWPHYVDTFSPLFSCITLWLTLLINPSSLKLATSFASWLIHPTCWASWLECLRGSSNYAPNY